MPKRTLLCILDWGLGHATRSLALLNHELLAGDEVFIATSGPAKSFIARERPDLPLFDLPSYAVTYPSKSMELNVAVQLPKWLSVIWREHRATQRLVRELNIDRIVSDNRFGCYAKGIPSIFLTHQLHPITGAAPVNWAYRSYLQRFDEFWVPDDAARSLSGKLAEATGYLNVRYIGWLSRFDHLPKQPKTLRTLSILSGPEPMRSRLEAELLAALPDIAGVHHVVRGTEKGERVTAAENIQVTDLASTQVLSELLPRAEVVICRAGYSTLMDLFAGGVEAKLILLPTPGQTEQEYLGMQLAAGGRGLVMEQNAVKTELADKLNPDG